MSTIKNSMRLAKICAFALSVVIFCFPTVAMAASVDLCECFGFDGGFDFSVPASVPIDATVNSVIVSKLGEGETLEIDKIEITNQNGGVEYNCSQAPFSIADGDDLIAKCASGPAMLSSGPATYTAISSNPSPNPQGFLCVDLEVEF